MKTNPQPSRAVALMEITARAVLASREGVVGFADRVADIYLTTVPVDQQRVKFRPMVGDIQQISAAQKANRQTVDRLIKGEVLSFPIDLEDAWVLALPEPHQADALRMLSGRLGLLPAKARSPREAMESVADATRAYADFIARMAPIMADGVIDSRDQPYLKPALTELADLQAALASLQAQLTAALPGEGGKVIPMRGAA
ncbi:hypothetical protein [Xylophilus sp.]|uniref:hypothetical protein n=1 Tax=Xylophilus sp. TaxID=2653893 RepID=UPI0013BA5E18|nr:hypothetical protein [Xylophilus sp.]KAF1045632.1 MAG: hypothetical protein GAK38_02924 [Xylophilus sp.]